MSASSEFFSGLRRLAVNVQNEKAALQEDLHKPPAEGAADMLLYNLRTDIKGLLDSAKKEYQHMQEEDGGFLEAAALVGKLLEKQKQALTDTEKHLQKYGYTPLVSDSKPSVDKEATCLVTTQQTSAGEDNTQQPTQQREEVCRTPEKVAVLRAVDPDRTPKLEDFGLSPGIYKRWQKSPKAATPAPHIQPHAQPNEDICDESHEPEAFRHGGLYVTPGMMGGRHISHITPVGGRSDPNDTPEPPVLITPALNRHAKQHHHNIQQQQEENDNTPEYPQLCTPGLGIQKPATQHSQQPLPMFALNDPDESDQGTPEPPTLITMNLRGLFPPREPAPPAPAPAAAPAAAPAIVVDRPVPSYQHPQGDYMATPEPPVLISRLKDLQSSSPEGKTLNWTGQSTLPNTTPQPAITDRAEAPSKEKAPYDEKKGIEEVPSFQDVIRPVSGAEYRALQDAVRRKVSITQLNDVIGKLNRYIDIATNIEGCSEEEVQLCPDNFKEECDCNAQMMFLVLQCLRRVKSKAATSNVYCVVK